MNLLISGGTGFIGRALTKHFSSLKHHVYILTRKRITEEYSQYVHYVQWLIRKSANQYPLPPIDVAINLAGASIYNSRWTESKKKSILQSRLNATKSLINLLSQMPIKPHLLISASTVGYYGTSKTQSFTETSSYEGSDFLADVSYRWETEALRAEELGIRTVLARFGLVLAQSDGLLPKMILPYKYFIGGTIASGKQWVSWIHIEDLVRLIDFTIQHPFINGPVNFTSPYPVTMKEFGQTIGKVTKRPHWFLFPSFILKLFLGEVSEFITKGQKVIPKKAVTASFNFKYPSLESALKNLLN
ncbi:TIGR01777 family oxidoreductase [Scopulibacillus cellulosilyticus]|uniref:TIGR01777 family oxidoreductase n=1 Tax=Scopulibacillus cellulosilyticus TaxID=2665665 RepID=A0ABW2Q059_9BACL